MNVFDVVHTTAKRIIVELHAGYPDNISQLYRGEVRTAQVTKEGPDIVTTIEAGDSEKELQKAHINLSVGKATSAGVVLTTLVRELGVGVGNTPDIVSKLTLAGANYGSGTLIFGSAARSLDDFCRSFGLEWHINDGVIRILELGSGLNTTAVFLSSDTGLVGSPSINHKGILKARALIQPDLEPGRRVRIEGFATSGTFRITEATYTGDVAGTDWYVDIEAKESK